MKSKRTIMIFALLFLILGAVSLAVYAYGYSIGKTHGVEYFENYEKIVKTTNINIYDGAVASKRFYMENKKLFFVTGATGVSISILLTMIGARKK